MSVVHFLLARGRWVARARLAALSIAAYGVGVAAGLGSFVLVYAIYGRARLFLETVTAQGGAFASGSYGILPFPVLESTYLSAAALMTTAPHKGFALEYVLPPAIYVLTIAALAARAVGGRWRERDTLTFGMLVFGVTAFRFALGRSDYSHVITADLPAVLLIVRLAVEASSAAYSSRHATIALRVGAAVTCLAMAIGSLGLTGVTWGSSLG